MTDATQSEGLLPVEQRHRDLAQLVIPAAVIFADAPDHVADLRRRAAEHIARFERDHLATTDAREAVPWHSPLGGLMEAQRVVRFAVKQIEQAKAVNTHIPGNPYDVALAALNAPLAELSGLISATPSAPRPDAEIDHA